MKDGGSAFPSEQGETSEGLWNQTYDPGMSLRDYAVVHFAAAWVRVLAHGYDMDGPTDGRPALAANHLAEIQADAMIARRMKEEDDVKK